jgi:sugar phosphate isomerase/epimerase
MSVPSRRTFHVVYDTSLDDSLQYASENGWTGIVPDLSVPRFSPEKISSRERKHLLEVSESLELEWGFHAPGDDVSLFATYPPVHDAIVDYFKQAIDLARAVSSGQTNLVIHSGQPPKFKRAGEKEDAFLNENCELFESTFFESVVSLIEYAHPDVDIVLENHRWDALVRHAIPSLIARGMRLCLDIPKLYDSGLEVVRSDLRLFQQFSESIEVVHVHDTLPDLGSHQVVGSGSIAFTPALELLAGIEHSPQYVFETRPREAATESMARFKAILSDLGLVLL